MSETLRGRVLKGRNALLLLFLTLTLAFWTRSVWAEQEGWRMGFDPVQSSPEAACRATNVVINTVYAGVAPWYASDGTWNGLYYDCFRRWRPLGELLVYGPVYYYCPSPFVPSPPGRCVYPGAPTPAPIACAPDQPGFTVGNPTQIASGDKAESSVDLSWGPHPLHDLRRTYRSSMLPVGTSGLGQAWAYGFERGFSVYPLVGRAPLFITLIDADGSKHIFDGANGTYSSAAGGTITSLDAGYLNWLRRTRSGELEIYKFAGGRFRLSSTHMAAGGALFYNYDANNRLVEIADAFDRRIQIIWNKSHTIDSIQTADAFVRFEYDEVETVNGGNVLSTVTTFALDNTTLAKTKYTYVNDGTWISRFMLSGVEHTDGVQFATFSYDESWRVRTSEHAGGAYRHEFSYPTSASRTVIDPLGAVREYALSRVNGQDQVTAVSQPGGSGCAPATNKLTYASNGLATSQLDFNQQKTCFAYDTARRLQTTRFEGLSASATCPSPTGAAGPGQRKITTRWHPTWNVKAGVAEPLRRSSYIYNGQPDLDGKVLECANNGKLPDGSPIAVICKEIIQPTSDKTGSQGFAAPSNGKPRITTFTYDEHGQLLSQTKLNDGGRPSSTSTREYYGDTTTTHTRGDLWKATDSTGHVTEYLEYTAAGRATKIRDIHGQLTTKRFDGLQRLVEQVTYAGTPAEEVTRFSYNQVGLVEKAELPDSTYLLYGYDHAERLTDITD